MTLALLWVLFALLVNGVLICAVVSEYIHDVHNAYEDLE